MDLTIQPHKLSGTVTVPPSKSLAHRAVICAALSDGTCKIDNIALSDDIIATTEAMKAFGAIIEQDGSTLTITGADTNDVAHAIARDCVANAAHSADDFMAWNAWIKRAGPL